MRALIQRVRHASVIIDGKVSGAIDLGLLVFLAVQKNDTEVLADRLLDKLIKYRVFSDEDGKMNLNVLQVGGALLLVSQFTLAADTGKGLRPSFSSAADPDSAEALYDYFVGRAEQLHPDVQTGEFAADMQVQLVNDGPVTFLLEVPSLYDSQMEREL